MPNKKIAFILVPPVIEITAGACLFRYRNGEQVFERATTIKALRQTRDRIDRALRRHEDGEEHIVEGD